MNSIQYIFDRACEKGCLELVKFCIENGADIHNCSNYALRISIRDNYYEIVKLLLENDADPYSAHNLWSDENAFWYAKEYKRPEIQILLEQYR